MTTYEEDDSYMTWRLGKEPPLGEYRRLDMSKLPPYSLAPFRYTNCTAADFWNGDKKVRFRFKNIWNEETARQDVAKEYYDRESRKITRRTQTKTTKMRRPFCTYCRDRGFPLNDCKTHYTKSGPEFGATITCPELLKQQCARCGEQGHTPRYCKSQFWLKTDPREIVEPPKYMKDRFYTHMLEEQNIKDWQQPIPPALHAAFDAYQEKYVKTSRIWIEMTGDHTKYTNEYRLCMRFEPTNGYEYFDVRPRTDYESLVQNHYEWMRAIEFEPDEAELIREEEKSATTTTTTTTTNVAAAAANTNPTVVAPTQRKNGDGDLMISDIQNIIRKYVVVKKDTET